MSWLQRWQRQSWQCVEHDIPNQEEAQQAAWPSCNQKSEIEHQDKMTFWEDAARDRELGERGQGHGEH
jgi:hypothetical protein